MKYARFLVAIMAFAGRLFPKFFRSCAGSVALTRTCAPREQRVRIRIDGEADDLALIDAVAVDGEFIGARALWEAGRLRLALLTRAEPASVGVSSIGGLLAPLADTDDAGLLLELAPSGGTRVLAPISPGSYSQVHVLRHRRLLLGEAVTVDGPCVLAFDGERERVLKRGQQAQMRVERDGPLVIDAARALSLAASSGLFIQRSGGCDAG